jgi:hypothetical protein
MHHMPGLFEILAMDAKKKKRWIFSQKIKANVAQVNTAVWEVWRDGKGGG